MCVQTLAYRTSLRGATETLATAARRTCGCVKTLVNRTLHQQPTAKLWPPEKSCRIKHYSSRTSGTTPQFMYRNSKRWRMWRKHWITWRTIARHSSHCLSRARRNLTTTGIVLSNKRFFEQSDGVKKAGVLHTLLQLLACVQESWLAQVCCSAHLC